MSSFSYPSFIGYPVDKPYISSWHQQDSPKDPKRPYLHMKLEDYPPYKALGPPPILHGPAPYRPHLSGCGLYHIAENMCVCSMECKRKPLYAWAKENPEAFQAKQREMAQWYERANLWCKQQMDVGAQWDAYSKPERMDFLRRRDEESPIGCADCELDGKSYCACYECEGCGSKYCSSCPENYEDPEDHW